MDKYTTFDDDSYFRDIGALLETHGLDSEFALSRYQALIRRRDLSRLLAHYELFKLVQKLPGSIVEVGVNVGQGLFTFANFLETMCTSDRTRYVYGFESCLGYENFHRNDEKLSEFSENNNHNFSNQKKFLTALEQIKKNDNILKGVERAKIIFGDIRDTISPFNEDNGGLKISLLYIDVNAYEPTKAALEGFFDKVVSGGIIAFNGYGNSLHKGETLAVDEFFEKRDIIAKFSKFTFSPEPSAYFIK